MPEVDNDKIYLVDEDSQRIMFSTDGNGDYYFTLYSNREARSGDYYPFFIDEASPIYPTIKSFIEQEIDYSKDEQVSRTPYFIIEDNSVRIADQNQTMIDAEWVKLEMQPDKIRIVFSEKFPASMRVVGVGRHDHYPFFLPVIDLYDALQLVAKENKNNTLHVKKLVSKN